MSIFAALSGFVPSGGAQTLTGSSLARSLFRNVYGLLTVGGSSNTGGSVSNDQSAMKVSEAAMANLTSRTSTKVPPSPWNVRVYRRRGFLSGCFCHCSSQKSNKL